MCVCVCVCVCVLVIQICPSLCNSMDSTVHGILKVRMLCLLPRDLPDPVIELGSLALQADPFHLSHQGNPLYVTQQKFKPLRRTQREK